MVQIILQMIFRVKRSAQKHNEGKRRGQTYWPLGNKLTMSALEQKFSKKEHAALQWRLKVQHRFWPSASGLWKHFTCMQGPGKVLRYHTVLVWDWPHQHSCTNHGCKCRTDSLQTIMKSYLKVVLVKPYKIYILISKYQQFRLNCLLNK